MINNKKVLIIAIIMFVICMILNFPFPHRYPFGELLLLKLNIPPQSNSGWYYIGIIVTILFLFALYLFMKSINKYYIRFFILIMLLFALIPIISINLFQTTFAKDIYAVSYDKEESECHFEMVEKNTLHGKCHLSFQNHRNKNVTFYIEFQENIVFDDDIPFITMLNNDGPHNIVLKEKESKRIVIESFIDVSNLEEHIESGHAYGIDIVIKMNGREREL